MKTEGNVRRTGKDPYEFDEDDIEPCPIKSNKQEMFRRAFEKKLEAGYSKRKQKGRRVSVRTGKYHQKRPEKKAIPAKSLQLEIVAPEGSSSQFASASDKIETDASDSFSNEDVAKLQGKFWAGSIRSSIADPKVTEITAVVLEGELMGLLNGMDAVCCSSLFTFMIDKISTKITLGSKSVIITWPLNEIDGFSSIDNTEEGFNLLGLHLTQCGKHRLRKCLQDESLISESGSSLKVKISNANCLEPARQITSLSDVYKSLWRPASMDSSTSQMSPEADSAERKDRERYGLEIHRLWKDLVFPKGDQDAVTVTAHDYRLLSPFEFLSDTIIDFYIKYLQSTVLDHYKERFYFFNSFFFRKITEVDKNKSAFERVKRWTAKINIFEKDYLFIPIMQSAHWSLVIVCKPGYLSSTELHKASTSQTPIILHFDSMKGCHMEIEEPIRNYLIQAWIQWTGGCGTIPAMEFLSAQVPQQTNYCDCGLFLLHYVELFIKAVQNEDCMDFVRSEWFDPEEVSCKRREIKSLIDKLLMEELGGGEVLKPVEKELDGSWPRFHDLAPSPPLIAQEASSEVNSLYCNQSEEHSRSSSFVFHAIQSCHPEQKYIQLSACHCELQQLEEPSVPSLHLSRLDAPKESKEFLSQQKAQIGQSKDCVNHTSTSNSPSFIKTLHDSMQLEDLKKDVSVVHGDVSLENMADHLRPLIMVESQVLGFENKNACQFRHRFSDNVLISKSSSSSEEFMSCKTAGFGDSSIAKGSDESLSSSCEDNAQYVVVLDTPTQKESCEVEDQFMVKISDRCSEDPSQIQELSRLGNSHYISSDEEPCTQNAKQAQMTLEAASLRREHLKSKKKSSGGNQATVRRPVTRSAKRENNSEAYSAQFQGRKKKPTTRTK